MKAPSRGTLAAVAIGCASALLTVLAVEAVFYGLNIRIAARTRLELRPESDFYTYRLTVGYRPKAGGAVDAVKTVDGAEIYRVRYEFDDRHRRVTEPMPANPGERLLLFFGDSITFGEGVAGGETIPAYAAGLAPDWTVLNYAFSGYGPGQAAAQLADDSLFEHSSPDEAVAVYVFIPHHVRRTIGSMRVVSQWGLHFPYYALQDDGGVALLGTFERDRADRTNGYRFFAREQIGRYFGVDWPLAIGENDLQLTAGVIAAARDAFLARYPGGRFYAALYPALPSDEFPSGRIGPYLEALGVEVLDLTNAVDMGAPGLIIPGDGHPTGAANALFAERLVKALALVAASP